VSARLTFADFARIPDSARHITASFIAIPSTIDWVRGDVAEDRRILEERIIASFEDFGESIKQLFSDHAPASIDFGVIAL
jgi:hypothetical protein